MRLALAVAVVASGCGRIGFDGAGGDGGDGGGDGGDGVPIATQLPAGGGMTHAAIAPDGTWYASAPFAGVWKSVDHATWTRCAPLTAFDVAVGADNTVYAAASDVAVSTDGCATWTVRPTGHYTRAVATLGAVPYALTDMRAQKWVSGAWVDVPTPADGVAFVAMAPLGNGVLLGTEGNGLAVVPSTGIATQITAGLASTLIGEVAAGPTRAYAITLADGSTGGGISCSNGAATTWAKCFTGGGPTLAVDPTDDQHVIASPYDSLVQTTDGFMTFDNSVQTGALDQANVQDIVFGPAGDVLVASFSGMYYAKDRGLAWQDKRAGLAAWNVLAIQRFGDEVFLATQGGVMRSVGGAPFTLSTDGMLYATRSDRIVFAPDGTLIATGRDVWGSRDRGTTWTILQALDAPDGYDVSAIAISGTRAVAGSDTRVLVADPPYATWTPRKIAGANHFVRDLAFTPDGRLWAATDDGVFVATDATAATWSPIAAIAVPCRGLLVLPDGGVVVTTQQGAWISDAAGAVWTHAGPMALDSYGAAEVPGGIALVGQSGAVVSRDRGASWTPIAGTEVYHLRSALWDAGRGELMVGTLGNGVVPFALP